MLKGLETLGLRVERHCANALAVAQHLERQAGVARVLYPGLPSHPQADLVKRQMQGGSTLVAFEVAGGKAGAFRLMNALRLIDISNNLGDANSLITHQATHTHQPLTPEAHPDLGIRHGLLPLPPPPE